MSKIVTATSLANMINTADANKRIKIVGRALVALFNRQTEDEKTVNDTREHNSIGFSGSDGKSGSLTAKFFLKHGTLLDWQLDKWLKPARNGLPRICKYHKQLNHIATVKAAK